MYTETVEYYDDICPESWKAVLPEYSLKLVKSQKSSPETTILTVSTECLPMLKKFLDDLEEGDLEPLDIISREYKYDEDYITAVKKLSKKLKSKSK